MSCRIERASRAGLIGLAVADLLCCAAALAVTCGRGMSPGYRSVLYWQHEQVRVLSTVYGPFVQNACVKSNTWLTVVVAVGRYLVICRPLHARYLVSVTATRLSIIAAFIVAILIELPTLWTTAVIRLECPGASYIVLDHGQLIVDSRLKMTYDVVSISLGFIVPVGVLVFCNTRLICSLRQSYQMARRYRASTSGRVSRGLAVKSTPETAETRLTLTLVCIVAMFLLLITPSELVNLYFYAARATEGQLVEAAIVITNTLQTANFSFNFVLYLAVNAQFRGAVGEACHCPAGSALCCRQLPTSTGAITLETVVPRPSPGLASTGTGAGIVDTGHDGRPEEMTSAVDVHVVEQRVTLRRREDNDMVHPVDEC